MRNNIYMAGYASYGVIKQGAILKNQGFTLAEVLITLGIIGIVSAMTIPNLLSNFRATKNATQLKKTISSLSQVATGGLAANHMNFRDTVSPCSANGGEDDSDAIMSLCAILNESLVGKAYVDDITAIKADRNSEYLITPASEGSGLSFIGEDNKPTGHAYKLADGTLFVFPADAYNCNIEAKCVGYIDVNGGSMPNKEVTCEDGNANSENCVVPQKANFMTDIYPVEFYDNIMMPSTNAGMYVLKHNNHSNIDRSGKTSHQSSNEED